MNKDLQNIKDIDDYLSGDLNPEHRNEFEKKLKGDVDLQEELDTIKSVVEGYSRQELYEGCRINVVLFSVSFN